MTPIGTPLTDDHLDALQRFFAALPDEDVSFMKEDVRDPDVVRAFVGQRGVGQRGVGQQGVGQQGVGQQGVGQQGPARRWVVEHGGEVVAYASLLPSVGWSDHVAELRLAVAPSQRRQGLGRRLAQTVLLAALQDGRSKVVVEVVAEQESAAAMFRGLGFEGEALLRDHVRDRSGTLRDVLVLAHFAGETSSALSTIGADS